MTQGRSFSKVLALLEARGWTLQKLHGDRRVFTKPGESILSFPVRRRMVEGEYVERILKIINEQDG